MTAQETKLFNAFETTLTATAGASDLTFTVNSVTDSYGSTLAANVYLVLNPDSSTNREVIEVNRDLIEVKRNLIKVNRCIKR